MLSRKPTYGTPCAFPRGMGITPRRSVGCRECPDVSFPEELLRVRQELIDLRHLIDSRTGEHHGYPNAGRTRLPFAGTPWKAGNRADKTLRDPEGPQPRLHAGSGGGLPGDCKMRG